MRVSPRLAKKPRTCCISNVLELDSVVALESTVAVQLGLFIAGVATARALREEGIVPDAVAGLSVGAYGAAVAC